MPYKQDQLQVFKNEKPFLAPDTSRIGLGPQKYDRTADTNGPGSNATATFSHGASSAVMHKTLSEQWFYIDGPEFYMWLCPEKKSVAEGKFYKVTPGSKIEIPSKTKFQIYNPSFEDVEILMVTNPFWPQDGTAEDEIASPEGPWHREDTIEFQADVVPEDYMDKIYENDPIAQQSSSGFEYIEKALASIGEDVNKYAIIGNSWFKFTGSTEFKVMPISESAKVSPALSGEELDAMSREVQAFEETLQKRKDDGKHTFEQGYHYYQDGNFSMATNYFTTGRNLGNASAAYYEGIMKECGEGCDTDNNAALASYKLAANLGHYGAFKQSGNLLYQNCQGHQEMTLRMISDKNTYLQESKILSLEIKEKGNAFFKAKDYPNALKHYDRAIAMHPNEATFHFNQGMCYKKLGKSEDALNAFAKAIELKPDYEKALYQKALMTTRQSTAPQTLFGQAMSSTAATPPVEARDDNDSTPSNNSMS